MRSAALDRGQDLDPIAFDERPGVPLRAGDDLGVDRHRDTAARALHVEALEDGGHGRTIGELGRLAVDVDDHAGTSACAPTRKRAGEATPASGFETAPRVRPSTPR